MSFMPMGDKILVEPFDRVKSDILEVVLTEKPNRGIVVAVGPGQSNKRGGRDQMPVKPGDRIHFGTIGRTSSDEYLTYTPYYEDGKKYLIMSWKDVAFIEN